MNISAEAALILGAIALYLYDTAMLLYSDELLFVRSRGQWRASLGSRLMLGGRFVALPAVLLPGTPVFRACWGRAGLAGAPLETPLPDFLRALRPLQWAGAAMALLLFVAMPVCLVMRPGSQLMLVLFLMFYGTALGCGIYLTTQRKRLGLAGHALSSALVDVLACPPFAVNVVRRVTLAAGPTITPDAFAREVLSSTDHGLLYKAVQDRLQAAMPADPAEAPGVPRPTPEPDNTP